MTPPIALPPDAESDVRWMELALEEARIAAEHGDVPVGCLVIDSETGVVLAREHNARELSGDPTAHAEILALRAAARARGHWRLLGTTVVVTLEPCPMCAGALVNARISRLVYGALDPKAGGIHTGFGIGLGPELNHRFSVTSGVLADRCAAQLQAFFAELRRRD